MEVRVTSHRMPLSFRFIFLMMFAGLSLSVVAQESNKINSENWVKESSGKMNVSDRRGRQLLVDRIVLPFSGTRSQGRIITIPSNVSKVRFIEITPKERRKTNFRRQNVESEENQNDRISWEPEAEEVEEEGGDHDYQEKIDLQRNWEPVCDYEDADEDFLGHSPDGGRQAKIKGHLMAKRPMKTKKRFADRRNGVFKNRYEADERKRDRELIREYHPNRVPPSVRASSAKHYRGPGYSVEGFRGHKRPGKGRKSPPNSQYTTHNPHVMTNLGLSNYASPNQYQFFFPGQKSADFGATAKNHENSIATAATNRIVSQLQVLPPEMIQAPKFREEFFNPPINPPHLVRHPYQYPHQGHDSSQRATLKDILEQDCPGHEVIGFCESPPRYPMRQIDAILKKCASSMEVMSTQNLIERRELGGFSSRSDSDAEISKNNNNTISMEFDFDKLVGKRRNQGDGVQACRSEFILIEPGYAREVTTGKWYVVVQNSETAQQRITTDSCTNPGKPCHGLARMQCDNQNNQAMRSTKCVQRFAYHRLISWDPDSPDSCPRLRIFKFPSACVCHVGTTS